jgi:hypothetical protein
MGDARQSVHRRLSNGVLRALVCKSALERTRSERRWCGR